MAGSATLQLQQAVLGHTLAFQPMTMPTGIFLTLCLATPPPNSITGGTEVTATAYARQPATFAISSANIAANTATVEFPAAGANWGTVGFFELWSNIIGGTRLYWGPLVDPADGVTPITRAVNAGDIVRLTAGTVQVQAT